MYHNVPLSPLPALCATVGFADGAIESANIVGYQQKSLPTGFSLTLPTFEDVGASTIDIQQIVPNNIGENVSGEISIQTFTAEGGVDTQYFYQTPESYWGMASESGWYLEDYATLAEKTFQPGEGVMADAPAGVSFTYSGQVNLAKQEFTFASGFSLSGNVRPMEVDIQKIVPENIGENVSGEISIQTFTAEGGVDTQYFYQTPESYWGMASESGWYLEDYATLAEKTFQPGEGFMIDSPVNGLKLNFEAISTSAE